MLYAGLDLSRQRLDVHVLDEDGPTVEVTAVRPDADALRTLAAASRHGQDVTGAIESMNGARFVHDQLELGGWDVAIADAVKVKGLAPLAAKTDKIDARVLAELARRDLVPEIWLPTPGVRAERERARFRLHLVRHRTALKNRIHATLIAFGHPVPVPTCSASRPALLERSLVPEPWARRSPRACGWSTSSSRDPRLRGRAPRARCRPPLRAAPDDRARHRLGPGLHDRLRDRRHPPVRHAQEARRVHRPLPLVRQSGDRDRRGPLAKNGPKYLRWALIEAAIHAARHPDLRERYERTKRRLGRQRGPKVARVELARRARRPPSGTCSPRTNPSPRQAPHLIWSLDDPV